MTIETRMKLSATYPTTSSGIDVTRQYNFGDRSTARCLISLSDFSFSLYLSTKLDLSTFTDCSFVCYTVVCSWHAIGASWAGSSHLGSFES